MQEKLVTVYTAMDETDAEVVKMALEMEEIPVFLENANQAGLAGCIPVKVQVPESVVDRAKSFIAKHEQSGGQY